MLQKKLSHFHNPHFDKSANFQDQSTEKSNYHSAKIFCCYFFVILFNRYRYQPGHYPRKQFAQRHLPCTVFAAVIKCLSDFQYF